MSSKAEAIADAIMTALTTPAMSSVPAARVFRNLGDALATDQFPAVVVQLGNEQAPQMVLISKLDRFLDVVVSILAAGSDPFTAADDALVESFNRIMADRTLGGAALDIVEGDTTREHATHAESVGATRKTFTVHYRTNDHALDS
jgi:hypothetical protein